MIRSLLHIGSIRASIIAALLLLSGVNESAEASGGAWVRKAKGYYFKIGFTSITAEKERGFNGEERPLFRDTLRYANGAVGISNISVYSEYGITNWLTSVISTQYTVVVRNADIIERGMEGLREDESASGLSDIWLMGRVNLFPKTWSVAGAGTLGWKIPTGSPYKEVPLGTGVVDYSAGLAVGLPIPITETLHGYSQISGTYRIRKKAADEFAWSIEAGANVIPTLKLQAKIDGVHSTADFAAAAQESESDPVVFSELVGSQSFTRLSAGVIYDLNDYLELNCLVGQTIGGRNTLDASEFSIGVAWHL